MESKLAMFKSKAQRAKFHVLLAQGKMSQKTIDEWERDTPKKLPERIGPKKKSSQHSSGHWKQYSKMTGNKKPRIKRMRRTAMDQNFIAGFEKRAEKERMSTGKKALIGAGIGALGTLGLYGAVLAGSSHGLGLTASEGHSLFGHLDPEIMAMGSGLGAGIGALDNPLEDLDEMLDRKRITKYPKRLRKNFNEARPHRLAGGILGAMAGTYAAMRHNPFGSTSLGTGLGTLAGMAAGHGVGRMMSNNE